MKTEVVLKSFSITFCMIDFGSLMKTEVVLKFRILGANDDS